MIYTVVGLLAPSRCLEIVATHGMLFTCMSCFSSFFFFFFYFVGPPVSVCDNDLCHFLSYAFYSIQGSNTCVLLAGSPS